MKIILVSDTHTNSSVLKTVREKFPGADRYIHCGDILVSPDKAEGFTTVRGNLDGADYYPMELSFTAGSLRILIKHGHDLFVGAAPDYGAVARYARKNGYVETLFGRRRYLPDINSRNGNVRALAERNAVNAPIQGTSADIIKLAMIRVQKRLEEEGLRSRMVLQIHDELVFDAIPSEVERLKSIVVEVMEHVIELSIPLTVECSSGKNWLEAH